MTDTVVTVDFGSATPPREKTTTTAVVKHFTQSLNLCSVCGSSQHRASKCQLRPAT